MYNVSVVYTDSSFANSYHSNVIRLTVEHDCFLVETLRGEQCYFPIRHVLRLTIEDVQDGDQ